MTWPATTTLAAMSFESSSANEDSICRPGLPPTLCRTRFTKRSAYSLTNGAFNMNAVLLGVAPTSRTLMRCVLSGGSKILGTP